ncbi:MAG: hypothetical protein Q8N30_12280 [Methylococcales bacterium]|nr:hypothetical protein [Methylococcales bacterium]
MKQLISISLLMALCLVAPAHGAEKASEQRLDEVAERGSHVVPFNLEQTTHVFSKTDKGCVQQAIMKDPANAEQIKLIRQHLTKISTAFIIVRFGRFAQTGRHRRTHALPSLLSGF